MIIISRVDKSFVSHLLSLKVELKLKMSVNKMVIKLPLR